MVSIGPREKAERSLGTGGKKGSSAISHFCSALDILPVCALPLCVPGTEKGLVNYLLNEANSVSSPRAEPSSFLWSGMLTDSRILFWDVRESVVQWLEDL